MTEAEKRATRNYRKKTNSVTILFKMFNDEERELYRLLSTIENKTQYIKDLIKEDMEQRKNI